MPFYSLSVIINISPGKTTEITLPDGEILYDIHSENKSFKIYSSKNSVDTIYLKKDSLYFGGDNKHYNQFLITAEASEKYCHDYSIGRNHELREVNILSDFKKIIASRKAEDNLLLKNNRFSEKFVEQQQLFTDMRYNALFLKKMNTLYNTPELLTDDWIDELKNNDFQLKNEDSRQSGWFRDIIKDYVLAKSLMIEKISPQEILKMNSFNIRSLNEFLFDNYCKEFSGENLEYALACLFYDDIFQEDYSKDIPPLYKRFLSLFPDSPYIGILTQGVKKTEDIYNQADNNSEILTVNYDAEPENFEEMMRPFAGKVVYIDIWATWCIPCLKMFSHLDNLKEQVRGMEDVVFFYISIDRDEYHEKWQKMSSYYNLHGYHYRINEHTSEIIFSTFGNPNGSIEVPRYAIVDKNGKIAFPNAAAPSEPEKVAEQLKTLLY